MKKSIFFWLILLLTTSAKAQIWGGSGGNIPENGVLTFFPITVNGLEPGQLTADYGLTLVAINISHLHDDDLEVYLVSPDSTTIALTRFNGSNGDNYTFTKFSDGAFLPIQMGEAPFTGTFLPEEPLAHLNNGQDGNGTWYVAVRDAVANNRQGTLNGWSLTFGTATTPPFVFTSSNLPIVLIDTYGQSIPDDPKIMAGMKIIDNGPGLRNNITDTPVYDGFAGIELRGSSSQEFPKKSFGLETWDAAGEDLKVSLLGMPEESDWILNANYTDKTLMRNTMAYQLFQDMDHYATRYKHVEVMLNGSYHGIYVFSEKIKRDGDRVDIAKLTTTMNSGDPLTGGYIVKIDKPTGSGGDGWVSDYPPPSHPNGQTIFFQYEYPKANTITPQQKEYISGYVDAFEGALAGPFFNDPNLGWRRYAVENTFVDYFIVNEISKNVDGYRLSTFLHKERESLGGKLRMGPVWDYDIAFRNADYCSGDVVTGWAYQFPCQYDYWQVPFWWQRLMQDTIFKNNLKCRWEDLRTTTLSNAWLNNYVDSIALVLNESQERNFVRWPILGVYVWPNPQPIPTTYAGEIQALKSYLQTRLNWLDQNMPGNCNATQLDEYPIPANGIKIQPNPATDKVLIETSQFFSNQLKISIFDLTGKMVAQFEGTRVQKSSHSYQLDIEKLNEGVWMVRFDDGKKSSTSRLLITR